MVFRSYGIVVSLFKTFLYGSRIITSDCQIVISEKKPYKYLCQHILGIWSASIINRFASIDYALKQFAVNFVDTLELMKINVIIASIFTWFLFSTYSCWTMKKCMPHVLSVKCTNKYDGDIISKSAEKVEMFIQFQVKTYGYIFS